MNKEKYINELHKLHYGNEPLLIGNVWDAHTAKLAQENGFKALGSSSHAIAFALGYKDGEQIPVKELLFMLERILAVSKIPVSVDFESGYSDDPKKVAQYVKELHSMGVQGINLEDGKVIEGKRTLQDSKILVDKIKAIQEIAPIFINARIDSFTTKQPDALGVTLERASIYENAGADGLFVPLIEKPEDIRAYMQATSLPLNVFASPTLPSFEELKKLGVKRISHGAKQYDALMKVAQENFGEFTQNKDFKTILSA